MRTARPVGPETAAAITANIRDPRQVAQLTERLGHARQALDRERFDEARRIASSLVRPLPNVAAVHEVIGLAAYRSGRWQQATSELELAHALSPSIELLPALADAYRAQQRWADVERVWEDVRAASPAHEVLAEARIVAAGAQADRGDLAAALHTMDKATQIPKRVRDHHLRQWYVLGDLHDRAGDALPAIRWFELVAQHDRDFVDVTDRLRALGR
ncbi:MAG: tetratricopeptide repeat protein [Ilumatobacteraceae bacterium]